VTLAAEIVDFGRFAHPKALMNFLGLVPSEYSSGDHRRQGPITRSGNGHARRILVEAAWNYRFPPRISRSVQVRQEGEPKSVRAISWKAQHRLSKRFRAMQSRKVQPNKICVALARELAGFVWSIAQTHKAEEHA
jgi:transposase